MTARTPFLRMFANVIGGPGFSRATMPTARAAPGRLACPLAGRHKLDGLRGRMLDDTRHDANLKLEQEGWPPRHAPACEPSSNTSPTGSAKAATT